MIEDKLSHDERLRLECVAQAISFNMTRGLKSVRDIIEDAKEFEAFIKTRLGSGRR